MQRWVIGLIHCDLQKVSILICIEKKIFFCGGLLFLPNKSVAGGSASNKRSCSVTCINFLLDKFNFFVGLARRSFSTESKIEYKYIWSFDLFVYFLFFFNF